MVRLNARYPPRTSSIAARLEKMGTEGRRLHGVIRRSYRRNSTGDLDSYGGLGLKMMIPVRGPLSNPDSPMGDGVRTSPAQAAALYAFDVAGIIRTRICILKSLGNRYNKEAVFAEPDRLAVLNNRLNGFLNVVAEAMLPPPADSIGLRYCL